MEYTKEDLLKLLNCSNTTFLTYIQRAEFANIKRNHKKGHRTKIYYTNVTEENINTFKKLLSRKKGYYYV